MKAVPGRTVGINKCRKDIEGAVRLTSETNMPQLVSGNNVIVYTDTDLTRDWLFRTWVVTELHEALSVVISCEDLPFQMRLEPRVT